MSEVTPPDNSPDNSPDDRVFMWMGIPAVGRPAILMVALANQPPSGHDVVFRPLVTTDASQALKWGHLADSAARELGVDSELREYQLTAINTVEKDVQS